jgi:hypothetical protein
VTFERNLLSAHSGATAPDSHRLPARHAVLMCSDTGSLCQVSAGCLNLLGPG